MHHRRGKTSANHNYDLDDDDEESPAAEYHHRKHDSPLVRQLLGPLSATIRIKKGARHGESLFYVAGAGTASGSTSVLSWLTTGAIACNFSAPRKSISFTPMVFLPTARISFTRVRTI
ncbi:MAG: hypothetical protein V7609_599 [Verrucomicrobiota bacterium]